MRILLISGLYAPHMVGGAEKVAQMLAESLATRGHEVRVLTTLPKGRAYSQRVNEVEVEYLPAANIYRQFAGHRPGAAKRAVWHLVDSANPWMANEVGRRLDSWRPDVMHTHHLMGFSTSVWKAAAARGVPIVHTLHDYYLLCPALTMFRSGERCGEDARCTVCRMYSVPRMRATRYVQAVVGVSRFILDRHLAAGCFTEAEVKTVVTNPCLVQPSTVARQPPNGGKLRLGYLGQISPVKGLETLLRAVAALPENMVDLYIGGVGSADYVNMLKMRYPGEHVHWLGFVKPNEVLSGIDALVVPSEWEEPASLVVLEALASGVRVVGRRRGGIPEMMGDAGLVFDSGQQLKELISNLATQPGMLQGARSHASRSWSEHEEVSAVDHYSSIYRQISTGAC